MERKILGKSYCSNASARISPNPPWKHNTRTHTRSCRLQHASLAYLHSTASAAVLFIGHTRPSSAVTAAMSGTSIPPYLCAPSGGLYIFAATVCLCASVRQSRHNALIVYLRSPHVVFGNARLSLPGLCRSFANAARNPNTFAFMQWLHACITLEHMLCLVIMPREEFDPKTVRSPKQLKSNPLVHAQMWFDHHHYHHGVVVVGAVGRPNFNHICWGGSFVCAGVAHKNFVIIVRV